MKFSFLNIIVVALALNSITLTISQPAKAYPDEYFCARLNGTYRTFKRTERGNLILLNFKRDVSEDWDKKRRCVEVSRRFQAFDDNDMLKMVASSDSVNNEPVLCAVLSNEQDCNSDNVLVTLPPGTEPNIFAQQLMDLRGLRNGREINVSGKKGKLATYINGNVYYDLEILEQRILQNSDRVIEENLVPITDY